MVGPEDLLHDFWIQAAPVTGREVTELLFELAPDILKFSKRISPYNPRKCREEFPPGCGPADIGKITLPGNRLT